MPARVTIVTSGHLATCPRMVKAADALHEAGYRVRVISTSQTAWAAAADRRLHARRGWRWECIAAGRTSAPWRWFSTGARVRIAQAFAKDAAAPGWFASRAFARLHSELVRAILGEPQDFIYGGTSGALAAVAEGARRSGTPFAVDFEDFHCGEHHEGSGARARDQLAATIMADCVRHASFVTVGSAAIGRASQERFSIVPIVINNVFPLPDAPLQESGAGPLRLYWFSQTIGPGRGLEDVVNAVGMARIPAELHLRGVAIPSYATELGSLCRAIAPRLRLVVHGPNDPDDMVASSRGFDVGLAVEPGRPANNALALSNKALTYPLAGLGVVLTRTPGQQVLADHLGPAAVSYEPGQVADLAGGLTRWHEDRAALDRAKEASWSAARDRWHWEHALERGALVAAVRKVA